MASASASCKMPAVRVPAILRVAEVLRRAGGISESPALPCSAPARPLSVLQPQPAAAHGADHPADATIKSHISCPARAVVRISDGGPGLGSFFEPALGRYMSS